MGLGIGIGISLSGIGGSINGGVLGLEYVAGGFIRLENGQILELEA